MSSMTLQDFLLLSDVNVFIPNDSEQKNLTGVSIDSRTVCDGNVFFAIQGERFDGHDFLTDVIAKGISAVVVHSDWESPSDKQWEFVAIIRVEDTTKALGEYAANFRNKFDIPVVGITGTNGKTTTKEMAALVLSQQMETVKTQGNFNNQFGLPLTLFQISDTTEAAVVELGASFPGEIAMLSKIAQPTHGIITNIGKGHMEFFKSIEEVTRTKAALIEALPANGTGIVNGDDESLKPIYEELNTVMTFGFGKNVDFRGDSAKMDKRGCYSFMVNGSYRVSLNVPGRNNMYNALAAVAAGTVLNMDETLIVKGIQAYKSFTQRTEITEWSGVTIINDSYNANPDSTEAALELLAEYPGETGCRRFAVLGNMLELGAMSRIEHELIGHSAVRYEVDTIITVGNEAQYIVDAAQSDGHKDSVHCSNHNDAADLLSRELQAGDILLIKGSRGCRMEMVLEYLFEYTLS